MRRNEKLRAEGAGRGLTPLGWVKLLAAGMVIGTPLYIATEHVLEHSRSAPEYISQQTAPGVILAIDPVAQKEGGVAMVDVTVTYEGADQKIRMPAAEAAEFSENQEVDVTFSVRLGQREGEVETRIDSIAQPADGIEG